MSPIAPFVSRTHIAYFSMEIALRPEMHTYAGGLVQAVLFSSKSGTVDWFTLIGSDAVQHRKPYRRPGRAYRRPK